MCQCQASQAACSRCRTSQTAYKMYLSQASQAAHRMPLHQASQAACSKCQARRRAACSKYQASQAAHMICRMRQYQAGQAAHRICRMRVCRAAHRMCQMIRQVTCRINPCKTSQAQHSIRSGRDSRCRTCRSRDKCLYRLTMNQKSARELAVMPSGSGQTGNSSFGNRMIQKENDRKSCYIFQKEDDRKSCLIFRKN